ncbi:MAG TPA: pyridoxamine 5'-phosphate oxidase family protein [Dehalococcoidia bacterium]|nr:pyridoxamine 5'-phosphate oxidase family protein [Dehalococcoidia bacterium]
MSSKGEPRVSPVDGHFLRGRFYFGTEGASIRIRHLRRNPSISISHFVGDDVAITIHGRAVLLQKGDPEADELAAL